MKKNWRKILSVLLAFAMVVTTYHVSPRAAGIDEIKDEFFSDVSSEADENTRLPKLGDLEEEPGEPAKPDLSEVVRVSIMLKAPSTVDAGYSIQNIASNAGAKAYRNTLKQNQAAVTAEIERVIGEKLDVEWNLTLAANIISANVTRGDIIKISALESVKKVIVENRYEAPVDEPNTSSSTGMIGADSVAWANGYYGAGSKIMIIDTGTNQDHISFDSEAFEYALTKGGKSLEDYDLLTQADVAAVVDQLNANNKAGKHNLDAESAYKNTKIPFAFNYVDGGYTTDHYSDTQGEHGSHVSGIAAANRYVKQNGAIVPALDSVLAVGVAPDAQILTAKVFGKGGGAYDSDYFAAIEDAIILGADAVNLSLGSAVVGFTFSDDYQEIMDNLAKTGLTMVTSAGNAYAFNSSGANTDIAYNYLENVNLSTGGSPGSFANTLSIASADNVGTTGMPLIFNDSQAVFYSDNPGYGNESMNSIAGETYEYVLLNGPGVNDNENVGKDGDDFLALGSEVLTGKVAMCFRGSSSFFAKANAAVAQGAIAVVIINNTDGVINMNLTGYEYTAPAVSILQADGNAVMAASEKVTTEGGLEYYTGTVTVTDTIMNSIVADHPSMSDFSSWGGRGSLTLKPEIAAPGGNIWSVNGMTNDAYENMSGTSMAAPHATGMVGLFGQYYREALKAYVEAAFPGKFTQRQLANSLLMSTAEPMIDYDNSETYFPVLQQGAGLANIGNAINAKTFLMMEDDATMSAADGKVKAELGQSTEGKYSYSFTIYNPSKYDLIYDLRTDLFTQGLFPYGGELYLDDWAVDLDGAVDYYFASTEGLHDVDKDGDTDIYDAQALLDVVSGANDGAEFDLSSDTADLDKDGNITSRDAYLLLEMVHSLNGAEEDEDSVLVRAGQSKTVNVTIDVSEWIENLELFTGGMWVEGYTFVSCQNVTDDGEILEVEHSIPLQGFLGSFAESTMYDVNSYTETLYGNTRKPYGGSINTNYLSILYPGESRATIFTGNPYAVEDEFPAERLAISSDALIRSINYKLIRAAGTTGWLALDADGKLLADAVGGKHYPDYYHWNQATWQETGNGTQAIGVTAADLGLEEGDKFFIGSFALPEYYAMKQNGNTSGTLTEDEFKALLTTADPALKLGNGFTLGFTFTVDDTRPTIEPVEADPESDEITVTFYDDNYVAYAAMMDPSASTVYDEFVPEQTEKGEKLTFTFSKEEYSKLNAVTFYVADYAGNTSYIVVRTGEGEIMAEYQTTIFVPAATMVEGKEYLIASGNEVGNVAVARSFGSGYRLSYAAAAIESGEFDEYSGLYIDGSSITQDLVWEIGSMSRYGLPNNYLVYNNATGAPVYLFDNNGTAATFGDDQLGGNIYYGMIWTVGENQLSSYYNRYLGIDVVGTSASISMSSEAKNVFFFEPITATQLIPYDPFTVTDITVEPGSYTLIPSIGLDSVQLVAKVEPVTAENKTLQWSSSDETVATVDETGLVKAVGLGEAEITAAATDESGVTTAVSIYVVDKTPMNAVVNGQIAYADGTVKFVEIDLNDMSTRTLHDAVEIKDYPFYGGGRGGNLIWGNDEDDDLHIFDIANDYAYAYKDSLNRDYAMLDAANVPKIDFTYNDTDYTFQMSAVTAGGYYTVMTYSGSLFYFDSVSDLGYMVAAAYVGSDDNYYYYYLLDESGTLHLWAIDDNLDERYVTIGSLSGIAMGSDTSAYSLTYAYGQTEEDALFLADNNNKAIWYINLDEMDETAGTIPATYVGSVDGISNISTLFNDDYDADGEAGIPASALKRIESLPMESARSFKLVTLKTEAAAEPAEEVTEAPAEEVTEAPAEEAEEPAEEVTEAPEEEAEEPAEEVTEAPEEEAEEPAEEVTEAPEEEAEEPAEEVTEAPEEEAEEPAEEVTEAPEEEAEEPAEEVTEAPEEEAEEPTEEVTEAPAEETPEAFGSLNAVIKVDRKEVEIKKEAADPMGGGSVVPKNVIMNVTEDVDSNNGLVTLTYDPEGLKCVKITASPENFSVNVDEEAGTITMAYAALRAVTAGDALLEVEFETVGCGDSDLTIVTNERNEELGLEEEWSTVMAGVGHSWKFEGFEWVGDDEEGYTAATAKYVCRNNEEHTITAEAEVSVETTVEATPSETGLAVYTAEVAAKDSPDGLAHTETKEVVLPKLPATYKLDKESIVVPAEGIEQLKLIGTDGSTAKGTWTSSDETIATVDSDGFVTGVKYGKAVITAVMEDGEEFTCAVQVLFNDVTDSSKYYYKPVYWAADHKPAITQGYGGVYFGVGEACQRRDFILFLYRLAGQPKVTDAEVEAIKETFSDLPEADLSKSFLKAIAWGYNKGIIKGYTTGELAGQFGYARSINRREAILMIWRYAGKPAAKETDLFKSFTDVIGTYKASSDSYKSIMWSVEKGISKGYSKQTDMLTEHDYTAPCFGCDLECLREDLIVFLYRADSLK